MNLLWSSSSIAVALSGIVWLSERPSGLQWVGILTAALGAIIYFYPQAFGAYPPADILAALFGVLANSVSSILGREVNRSQVLSPLAVTVASMGIGAALLVQLRSPDTLRLFLRRENKARRANLR